MKASCHSRNSLAAFSLQFMFTGQSFLLKGILRIWEIRPILVFRICFLCKSDRQADPCKLPFRSYIIISDTL